MENPYLARKPRAGRRRHKRQVEVVVSTSLLLMLPVSVGSGAGATRRLRRARRYARPGAGVGAAEVAAGTTAPLPLLARYLPCDGPVATAGMETGTETGASHLSPSRSLPPNAWVGSTRTTGQRRKREGERGRSCFCCECFPRPRPWRNCNKAAAGTQTPTYRTGGAWP